ncbi:MAG: AraC family transcriptional regulator [Mariniphaga sp.]|jgi:AraC-like DNA-binding protein|nr:AraC family transcriptional regulator [Mariniphaga sp.]
MQKLPIHNEASFGSESSFSVMKRPCIDLVFPYHMHPNYQLNFVISGKGKRVVGDHSENYQSGDLVLIGPNLPHYWTYDKHFKAKHGTGEAVIIHFDKDFAGSEFISKPEIKPIKNMLEMSHRGIFFKSFYLKETVTKIVQLPQLDPSSRLIFLINILFELSKTSYRFLLAGEAYEKNEISDVVLKINRIINFIKKHFNEENLNQSKLAEMAGLSNSSFSRYFRRQTGKNYIDYLKDIRLSHAYKLLNESDLSVSQIAAECGYLNLSNFNKQFKLKYNCTPKTFLHNRIKINK